MLKSRCKHPGTTGFPLIPVGQAEDQQMILGGRFADVVSPLGRELQMVGRLGVPEDDAIEAVVVFKLGEDGEVQPCSIHLCYGCQMIGGSSDTEHSTRWHRSVSFPPECEPIFPTSPALCADHGYRRLAPRAGIPR